MILSFIIPFLALIYLSLTSILRSQHGLISVLRHGFKHRGINFRVCYFKPESELNELANEHYRQNVCQCIRQWYYTEANRIEASN